MMRLQQILLTTMFVMLVSSCQSMGSNTAKSIEGSWTYQIGEFPVEIEYSAGQVHLAGHSAMPYSIEQDRLVVAGVTRLVSFPNRDEMIQTDPLTNTDQKFMRVKSN
jgi:hypothetical protein